jgi:hypothetical protein
MNPPLRNGPTEDRERRSRSRRRDDRDRWSEQRKQTKTTTGVVQGTRGGVSLIQKKAELSAKKH